MTEKDMRFDALTFRQGDLGYLLPCVDVTLYWAGSVFDHSAGILDFYRQSLALITADLTFYRTETMGAARPLKKDTFDLLPLWLGQKAARRDIYMLFLESGAAADEPSDLAFAMSASPGMGYVRLMLPPSYAVESRDAFLDLALRLGRTLSFDSGQGGFALNWNPLGKQTRRPVQTMHALAARYPGLDISYPSTTQFVVLKGIKGVNWLTFLGSDYAKRLGGMEALRKTFSAEITLHDLGGGRIAIQAGAAPQIGDVNRQDTLPLYREVGRAVASVRATPHPRMIGPGGIPDDDSTETWLSRFDS
jgi:hypothetical protein